MTEEERIKETTQKELLKSKACERLSENPDFKVFREMLDETLNGYRMLLEERSENERSNVLRGGIAAIRDIFSLFDTTKGRGKSLEDLLEKFNS